MSNPLAAALAGGPPAIGSPQAPTIDSLNLTPQEKFLYNMHLQNTLGPGGITNFNGSRSTLRQFSTEMNGRTYNLPTVWNGQVLTPQQAMPHVRAAGVENFPSYATPDEAEARYGQMHQFLDQDIQRAKQLPIPLGTPGVGDSSLGAVFADQPK